MMGILPLHQWQAYPHLVLDAWVELLDKGTKHHDKIAIAQVIESLGAHVSFGMMHGHVCWSAQCLRSDVSTLYPWIQDMLTASEFPEEEIELWRKLTLSAVREDRSEPSEQAGIAFSRQLYPEGHPMRMATTEEDMAWLEAMDAEALRAKIQQAAWHHMSVIVVGDVDVAVHQAALAAWNLPSGKAEHAAMPPVIGRHAVREHIEIPDKMNVDVRMGQSLAMDHTHPDYWPLMVGVDALGGTFSARLMRTVRDVEGLTYGINSSLHGLARDCGGHFGISITLSPENLARGIASTEKQLKRWWSEGITEEELFARKRGLLGRHAVRATKTMQIASLMRHGLVHNYGADYASHYAQSIAEVTCDQVNVAIKRWIDLDAMIIVTAGTLGSAG
jgi:zinc protease